MHHNCCFAECTADFHLGCGLQLTFIVECSLDYHNKTLASGKMEFMWVSNPDYCAPKGPILDACAGGIFKWEPIHEFCQNVYVYDPNDPKQLLVGFERLCKTLPFGWVYNTSYWPQESAFRLIAYDTIVAITDGVTEDGRPKIVDHILGDFDFDVLCGLAHFDRITGPRASDFIGFTVPIGFSVTHYTTRWGFFRITPKQDTFAPIFSARTTVQPRPWHHP
jgi:hypothetical protein